jgi:hypothetical protein
LTKVLTCINGAGSDSVEEQDSAHVIDVLHVRSNGKSDDCQHNGPQLNHLMVKEVKQKAGCRHKMRKRTKFAISQGVGEEKRVASNGSLR